MGTLYYIINKNTMTKESIEIASILSRWAADEDEVLFVPITEESARSSEEEPKENVLQ